MRRVLLYAVVGTESEVAGTMEDESGYAELGGHVDCPREEHVGDDAVWAVAFYKPLEGLFEEGDGLHEGRGHLWGSDRVEILTAVGEAGFGARELEEVDGDVLGPIDGGLDAGRVEGGGDYGGMNSLVESKELGQVCHGNQVARGH